MLAMQNHLMIDIESSSLQYKYDALRDIRVGRRIRPGSAPRQASDAYQHLWALEFRCLLGRTGDTIPTRRPLSTSPIRHIIEAQLSFVNPACTLLGPTRLPQVFVTGVIGFPRFFWRPSRLRRGVGGRGLICRLALHGLHCGHHRRRQ